MVPFLPSWITRVWPMGSVGSSCCTVSKSIVARGLRRLGADAHDRDLVAVVQHGVGRRGHVVVADQLHVVRLQQLVDRARRRVEGDLLVVDGERAADPRAVHDGRAGREATGIVAHRGELAELQLLGQLVGAGLDRAHGAHGAVDVDGDGERAQHVDVEAVVQRARRGRDDDVAGAELHVRGGEQRADGVGVGAHLLAGAVDDQRDLASPTGAVACWTIQAPPSAVSTTMTATPSTRGAGR